MKEKLKEKFLEKAKLKFGDKFDYSKVDYINCEIPVTIICPIHGEFEVKPISFLQSKHGCKKCSIEASHKKTTKTTEQFIEEAKNIWGDKFTYENTKYVNSSTKLTVTCPIHGDFLTRPADFLRKHGCPKCKGDRTKQFNSLTKSSNTEKFINKSKLLYPGLFSYDKVEYVRNNVLVIIHSNLCNEDFVISPNNFLRGNIPKRYLGEELIKQVISQDTFIEKLKILRPEFDYSKTVYKGSKNKFEVICPEHGPFLTTVADFIYHNGGCPICSMSHGEKVVANILNECNIEYTRQYPITIEESVKKLDFLLRLNNKYVAIEYNGKQHYKPVLLFGGEEAFKKQVIRDIKVKEYCNNNNIILLEYKYDIPFYKLNQIVKQDLKDIINNEKT